MKSRWGATPRRCYSTTDKTYRLAPEAGDKTSTVSLGYSHSLSTRTELYAALMHDRKEQLSAGRSYSLGLRHRF